MFEQHPLLGTNDVLQLLRLVAFHEQRHQNQISETIKDPMFPWARERVGDPCLL